MNAIARNNFGRPHTLEIRLLSIPRVCSHPRLRVSYPVSPRTCAKYPPDVDAEEQRGRLEFSRGVENVEKGLVARCVERAWGSGEKGCCVVRGHYYAVYRHHVLYERSVSTAA